MSTSAKYVSSKTQQITLNILQMLNVWRFELWRLKPFYYKILIVLDLLLGNDQSSS